MQQMECAGRNPKLQAVAVFFVEESHILPMDIAAEELSDFSQMQTPVTVSNRSVARLVVAQLYEENM